MGYSVYWSNESGKGRWQGYGVDAWCDFPGCKAEIDRGLSYKCEHHYSYDENDEEIDTEGCDLFFCSEHETKHEQHLNIQWKELPKEHPDWINHVSTDESWEQWRNENPETLAALRADLQ